MEELSLADYIAILKRHKKYFMLTFFSLWILSFIVALSWSNYRSMATVEIEQPEIATSMTTPVGVNPSDMSGALADLHVNKLEQKVTSPSSLVEIISKFNLYSNVRKYTPMANVAERMRNKIKLDLISSTVANPAAASKVSVDELSAIAFTLSFDYSDPQIAQQVTNELVTRFLDEDLKERRTQAEETSSFLATQISGLDAAMVEQEKKISEFQQEHGISKPEALIFNQQAAASTAMSLQALESQITANEGTQGSLRAQIATVDPYSRVIADGQVLTTPTIELKALQAQYTTLTSQYGPEHPDVVKLQGQIKALKAQLGNKKEDTAQLKEQILDVETNLKADEETYGAEDPDVITLKSQLKKLQAKLAAQGPEGTNHSNIKDDADNPAYIELMAQLSAAEEQHKSLVKQHESLAAQQAKYAEAVVQNPALEQQMAVLSRDYDNSQLRYRELKEKKMAADMEQQMVQDRKGQRLVVISPPELPLNTHPSRFLLIIAGFVVSLMGGVASIILAQAIGQNVLGTTHLTTLLGVAPMITIPHIFTNEEVNLISKRKPRVVWAFGLFAFVAVIAFLVGVMPFEVLWSVISQHLGLS